MISKKVEIKYNIDLHDREKRKLKFLIKRSIINQNRIIERKENYDYIGVKDVINKVLFLTWKPKLIFSDVKNFSKRTTETRTLLRLRLKVLNVTHKTVFKMGNRLRSVEHRLLKLPGSFPKTLNACQFDVITQSPDSYLICEKTDGERYMLYIEIMDSKNIFLINRKFVFLKIEDDKFSTIFFQMSGDTLLDGEIIRCNGIIFYFVFDIIQIDGINVSDDNLIERLNYIKYITKLSNEVTNPPIILKQKIYYSIRETNGLFLKIKRLRGKYFYNGSNEKQPNRENDGLIFTRLNTKYENKNSDVLKWKWMDKNTIDLRIRKPYFNLQGGLNLFAAGEKGKDILFRTSFLSTRQREMFEELLCKVKRFSPRREDFIVECGFSTETRSWIPVNSRLDKNFPNFIVTATSMFSIIIDSLDCREIIKKTKLK